MGRLQIAMIQIAHEATEETIQLIRERTDLDFAIAHFVKRSKRYAHLYRDRPKGRLLMLDNGKFELGAPLSSKEVAKAAEAVNADYVIPPDFIGEREQSLKALVRWIRDYGKVAKIAPVIIGKDPWDMVRCHDLYVEIPEIAAYCFSFMSPRCQTLIYLAHSLDRTKPYHLLGFAERRELVGCLKGLKGCRVSIDTMKPVSAAYCNMKLTDVGRGVYLRPPLRSRNIDKALLVENIDTFRGWVQAAEGEANGNKELA